MNRALWTSMTLAALLAVGTTRAQTLPSAASKPPAVKPPVLLFDPGVSYPEASLRAGKSDAVTVRLLLEIEVDGSVRTLRLEEPVPSEFEQAALAAARALRFEPARRAGAPVAAKIRFHYEFVAPRDPAQTAEPQSVPETEVRQAVPLPGVAAPGPAAKRTSATLELVVRGERTAPAVKSFTRTEVRQLPGAFGDPFRAIEAMPGVTPTASGLPFFYVRGAPPGNVGYFVDGIRIPFLYHVAIGPSVIHPALVERVDLYPGGYPASLGRFAGAIVSAETTAPRVLAHGEGNVRLFDAGALVETGFGNGRGSVLLGGRYSYTAALFSQLVPELALDYRDYQARIGYDLTERDRVTVLALGSYDLLAQRQRNGLDVLFGSEFYRADLRHEHRFDSGKLTTSLTLGFDQSKVGDQGTAIDRSWALRTRHEQEVSASVRLRAGADLSVDGYATARSRYTDPDNPETTLLEITNPSRADLTYGVWHDWVLRPAPGIEVTPGARLDLYHSRGNTALAFDPRIAARFRVAPWLTIIHADGIAHQPPAFVVPVPGRAPASLAGGLQRSIQTSAGIEVAFPERIQLSASVFYNAFFNMSDELSGNVEGPPGSSGDQRSLGSALGFELFARRSLSNRLGGFLSYTVSRSLRSQNDHRFPSAFDRTHVVNAAIGYDLGRAWRVGGRLVFYTGSPKQFDSGGLTVSSTPDGPRNSPFFRLDVRLEKRWSIGDGAWLSFVMEIMNATLAKENLGESEVGPITIPSLGLEAGF